MKKKLFLMVSAAMALAACSNEELLDGPATATADGISFRAVVDHSSDSRSVETESNNLYKFMVTAMEGETNLFSNLMFEKKGSKGEYVSNPVYEWSNHLNLDFYAIGYGTDSLNVAVPAPGEENSLFGEVTIDNDQKTINNFSSLPNIEDQIDLVFAKTTSGQTPNGGAVQLVFDHILSELEVVATCSSKVHQVEVKGIKYGNISNRGDFNIDYYLSGTQRAWTIDDNYKLDLDVPCLEEPVVLSSRDTSLSATDSVGWAVVLPQTLTTFSAGNQSWDGNHDGKTKATCAYVALLIRITALEDGNPTAVKFPVEGDAADENGFGWAYVPFHTDAVKEWTPGKRYIYHIDFTNGAGYNEEGNKILDNDIQFTASVNAWSNVDVYKKLESTPKK